MSARIPRVIALAAFVGFLCAPQTAAAAGQATRASAALSSVEAIRATATSGPVIAAAPLALNFGYVTIGQTSTRSLTISNSGDQTLLLVDMPISDSRFTSSFSGSLVIPAGGFATLLVFYDPTGPTVDAATLTLVSNAVNGPLTVVASGTGVPLGSPDLGAGRILIAPTGESAGDQYGISAASARDLNGDGFGDVIVGAWTNDAGGPDAGRAYIYLGGATPSDVPARILQGTSSGENFGTSVASAGDVNGDGFPDVVVGAWRNGAAGTDAGRAYLYFGGPGMDGVADLTFTGQAAGDRFGVSVSSGDMNGDGYSDVVVGAFLNDAGASNGGRVYVYFGGPSADAIADWVLTGSGANDNFGWTVSGAGDLNADGYGDVVVGAYGNDAGGTNAGRAFVYYGGVVPNSTPDWILTGEAAGDQFGVRLASAGDVNGDGFPDVIVGANFNSAGGLHAGRAYVYHGGPGADTVPDLTFTGDVAGASFGASVSSAGDVNGDGFDDLLVGSLYDNTGGTLAGRAHLFHGGPSADALADAVFTGQAPGDQLGQAVAPAGDVDGDGRDDIVLGAYFNDSFVEDAGRAYVVSLNLTRAPVVVSPSSVAGAIGAPISFGVTATDPDGGEILSLTAAPLPAGAAFTANGTNTAGTFAWTPGALQAGGHTVTFTASNGAASGSATTTINVGGGNSPPVVTAPASVVAAEGTLISFAVQASDPDGDHVALGILNRPAGSVFVDYGDNTGSFSWTPGYGQAGFYTISFTGRDGLGAEAAPKAVAITVDNVNRGPTAASGGPYAGVVNVPIAFDGTASSDPDGDALTHLWSFGDLGSGTGPNPLHAYATGGYFTVTLTVGDGTLTASASTTATVQDVFPATSFLEGGNKTTRLNSGKSETCVQIEPVDRAYLNSDVSIGSIVMISAGTGSVDRIGAIGDKTTIGADRDRNGVDEITACFAKTDLRNLFSSLSGGRHTVGVVLEGLLTTGGRFRTTLELDVVASGNALAASVSPNPLNPAGVLTFRTTLPGSVTITLFDPAGRLVRTIMREPSLGPGYHDVSIDGRSDDGSKLSSGIYFYRVETFEGTAAGRIVVLK